jgi:hypothetical protein
LRDDSFGHLVRFSLAKAKAYLKRQPDISQDRQKSETIFKGFYPYDPATLNPVALEAARFSYLLTLEALSAIPPDLSIKRYLEVGAGNAVAIAHQAHINRSAKFTIIDMPEMICAAYLMLRMAAPELKIALPSETSEAADVQFLLPYQTDRIESGVYDLAFNMASFQEMEQSVVNNYLRVFQRALRPGGAIILLNQEKSRYIAGNAIKNYDLSGFEEISIIDAPFTNITSAKAMGLNSKIVSAFRI